MALNSFIAASIPGGAGISPGFNSFLIGDGAESLVAAGVVPEAVLWESLLAAGTVPEVVLEVVLEVVPVAALVESLVAPGIVLEVLLESPPALCSVEPTGADWELL